MAHEALVRGRDQGKFSPSRRVCETVSSSCRNPAKGTGCPHPPRAGIPRPRRTRLQGISVSLYCLLGFKQAQGISPPGPSLTGNSSATGWQRAGMGGGDGTQGPWLQRERTPRGIDPLDRPASSSMEGLKPPLAGPTSRGWERWSPGSVNGAVASRSGAASLTNTLKLLKRSGHRARGS